MHGTDRLITTIGPAAAAFILLCVFSGCVPPTASSGRISLTGIEASRNHIIEGLLGERNIASETDGLTAIGETGYTNITIENGGTGDLVITDIDVYRDIRDADGEVVGADTTQNIFGIPDGAKPDLPLVIPAGRKYTALRLYFKPAEVGYQTGLLVLETDDGQSRLRLTGTGVWNLILTVPAGSNGKIVAPVQVVPTLTESATVLYRAPTDVVRLVAETTHAQQLTELQSWTITSPGSPSEVTEPNKLSTTITLRAHTNLTANFYSPYIRVGGTGPYATLSAGITAYNAAAPDTLKGIVVAVGSYTLAGTIEIPDCLFRGGYSTDFNSRAYKTSAERSGTYPTVINVQGSMIRSGTNDRDSSLFEGFTINGGTSDTAIRIEDSEPGDSLDNGSRMVFRYNTINFGTNYGFRIVNASPTIANNVITMTGGTADPASIAILAEGSGSSPVIENNTITAGNGTMHSIGIHVYDHAAAEITGNTVTAGNSTAGGGESVGIYGDYFCDLTITDNTITAGGSVQSNGKSCGVFLINSTDAVITGNTVNGGTGRGEARTIYAGYGGRQTIEDNTLFTSGGAVRTMLYIGPNGRVDSLVRNNMYGCPSGFVFYYLYPKGTELNKVFATLDEVNEEFIGENGDEADWNTSDEP